MNDYRAPDDLNRYIDARMDEVQRYHLRLDKQAEGRYDAYAVSLPPWLNEPGLLVETFEDAMTTLVRLRSQPFAPIYPPDVWQPMGIIIATNFDTVSRDIAIRTALIVGGTHLTDEESAREQMPAEYCVAALARAIALLRGAPLPIGSMEHWQGLRTIQ